MFASSLTWRTMRRRNRVVAHPRFCDSAAVPSHPSAGAIVAVAIVVATAGCGSARSGGAGQPLTPDANGWVDQSTTGTTGIHGPWYAFTDRNDCVPLHTDAECSKFVTPSTVDPFPPTAGLGMCAVGVVAKVIAGSDGKPDYSHIWGARIAFDFNEGADYDAPAQSVTGLAFHIDAEPPRGAEMNVILTTATAAINPASWGGATAEISPVHAGRNEFRWADVGGPSYLTNPPPPPFDPAQLLSIQFGVKADEFAAKSFAFCISELTALTD